MTDDFARTLIEIQPFADSSRFEFRPDLANVEAKTRLREVRNSTNLALVLGAGVSDRSGIGKWEDLVMQAATEAFIGSEISDIADGLVGFGAHSPVKVRLLETTLGLRAAFRSSLIRALYMGIDFTKPNGTLDACALLAAGLGDQRFIPEVMTYNFDNLFELKLASIAASGSRAISVYSAATDATDHQDETIRVYHPHGYLPYGAESEGAVTEGVVFSEEEYHRHFFNSDFWANKVQARLFSTKTCLFVGVSFTDPNLRRLLDFSNWGPGAPRPEHYAFVRLKAGATDRAAYLQNYLVSKDFETLRVRPIWIRDFDEIPAFLKDIM